MNKTSKIFLVIIIILIILLGVTVYSYFDMKRTAQKNMNNYLNALGQVHELKVELDSMKNEDNIEE